MAMSLDTHQTNVGQLRTSWFSQVYEISDIELQRRTWLDPANRNPHWSYIEFSSFPDCDQLSYALEKGWLTANEFDVLSDFRRILVAYHPPGGDYYDNAAVLDDSAWQSVIEAAERAKQQLLKTTTNREERAMLLGDGLK